MTRAPWRIADNYITGRECGVTETRNSFYSRLARARFSHRRLLRHLSLDCPRKLLYLRYLTLLFWFVFHLTIPRISAVLSHMPRGRSSACLRQIDGKTDSVRALLHSYGRFAVLFSCNANALFPRRVPT